MLLVSGLPVTALGFTGKATHDKTTGSSYRDGIAEVGWPKPRD